MIRLRSWRLSSRAILRVLSSNTFCRLIFAIFIIQAVWIAVSGVYSMAFDEYFHLGIIKIYAHHWSPFIGHQPPGPALFGAIARDPSYLYHYLMSFPYRIFAHFVGSQTLQIIFLRLIDIALFTTGLFLFRKLFKASGMTAAVTNICLFFFVLLPVTSFMAGQINYDNLMFLCTGASMYLAVRLTTTIRERDRLPLRRFFVLIAVLFLSSLVKYAFLPIALGITIYLLVSIFREIGFHRLKPLPAIRRGKAELKTLKGVAACLLLLLSGILFTERYGINTIRYHTPTPECNVVLSVNACRAYDPFARNQGYKDADYKATLSHKDVVSYPVTWLRGMIRSVFFSVGPRQLNYPTGNPLPVAYAIGSIVGVVGGVLIIIRSWWLWKRSHAMQLFLIVSIVYLAVLFIQNLSDYLGLGVPVAVQGRYSVPVLLLGFALVAVSSKAVLVKIQKQYVLGILTVCTVLMLQGGGVIPFIIRSSDEWMWPHSVPQQLNHDARAVLWPIIVH